MDSVDIKEDQIIVDVVSRKMIVRTELVGFIIANKHKNKNNFLSDLISHDLVDDEWGGIIPRHYQFQCLMKTVNSNVGCFELFCGTGKSMIIAMIANAHNQGRVVIVFPRIELME